ncbi:endonuclease/exonuclease/phosphatase family protein [Sinomicrobium soli]|uniref:endonuclease/exonuclease/phosphatase family protein n=1 Tax=Sinomicrobium sp. N-1-3-6 TaxID=2219864 RepID=UPI0013752B8E|nr:endonuclease/exonuclease/phosphatase family protein [Sinomicrobium sp. N-1-3-6]
MKKIYLLICSLLFVMILACSSKSEDEEGTAKMAAPDFTAQNSYMDRLVLNWETLSGATEYEVRYSDAENMTDAELIKTGKTFVDIENLEKGSSYFFQVRAQLKSGWTDWSAINQINTASFEASITTYNVLGVEADPNVEPEYAWHLRKEALKAMILQANNNPDIIAFQETTTVAPEIKEMIGENYDSHISEREVSARLISWKPGKFELVSYNDDIDIFGSEVTGRNTARYIAHVRLREIETGKEILVYNVHVPASTNLPKKDGQRIRQIGARNLAEYVKQEVKESGLPAVVLGDLNNYFDTVVEGIKSAPKVLSENGFADTFQEAPTRTNEDYSTTVNRATSSVKPGENGSRRLDYIFVYPGEQVSIGDYSIIINFSEGSSTRLQEPVPSDHHPVKSVLYFSYD